MDVWVIETGEYEQRGVVAVASSVEAAEKLVKEIFKAPYIVTWKSLVRDDDDRWSLSGEFKTVPHYHVGGSDRWDFTRYTVDEY